MSILALMELSKILGKNARRMRKDRGLSQEDLAAKAELSQQQISKIEGGSQNVTLRSIAKLAKAFGVSDLTLLLPSDVEVRKKP
ncbi:helix-turn-helix domain-containing protein [Labrys neptuniae]